MVYFFTYIQKRENFIITFVIVNNINSIFIDNNWCIDKTTLYKIYIWSIRNHSSIQGLMIL